MEQKPAIFAGSWSSLDVKLGVHVRNALNTMRFSDMTPVQAATIPLLLNHKDVAVQAVTGSGKTLSFIIPLIELLQRREEPLKSGEIGAIVIVPTRELATQVSDVMQLFTKDLYAIKTVTLTGGSPIKDDLRALAADEGLVIVATPGRLEHVFKTLGEKHSKVISRELELLVLDEADKLLDMGFEASLEIILSHLPKQRRTGLFSATQTRELKALIRAGMRNPVSISVETSTAQNAQQTPLTLENYYLLSESSERLSHLVNLLNTVAKGQKVIVYFLSCACVDYFGRVLPNMAQLKNVNILSLHGKMDQKKREKIFKKYSDMSEGVLLATDVAARGLDMPDVDWVVQFDPPQDPAMFVHRCGRTARLGRTGHAVVFLRGHEDGYISFLNLRHVPLMPFPYELVSDNDVVKTIREMALNDRDIYEKSQVALVSSVRAYSEHQCNLVFRKKDLDIVALANGYGLIRLPRMPELRDKQSTSFHEVIDVDFDAIPYKNEAREAARLVRAAKPATPKKRRKRTEAFSEQKAMKSKRQEKRKKRERKREAIARVKQAEHEQQLDDDLLDDSKALKRLKKGLISGAEFDEIVGMDAIERE